jgi:cell division protease FtsH
LVGQGVESVEVDMNPTVKTILAWVLILFVAVGLWNLVERVPQRFTILSFTDFLDQVEKGQVAEVTITGSTLTGRLQASNREFQSVMPSDYPAMYEKLIDQRVKVMVVPDRQDWATALVTWVLPMLLAFGLGWVCASKFRSQRPASLTT